MPNLPQYALLLLTLGAAAASGCASGGPPSGEERVPTNRLVNYYVRSSGERWEVTVAAERLRRDSVDFVLPAWTPGQYAVGSSRTLIENFAAKDGEGRPVAARRLGLTAWRLYPGKADYLTISYEVEPDPDSEPLPFRNRLDLHGGYSLGSDLLGALEGFERRAVTVSFDVPLGWRVVSSLKPAGATRYSAASYDDLPGAIFLMGDQLKDYKVFLQGRPHEIVVEGAGDDFAPDSLLRLVSETVDYGTRFLGDPPYERYLFAVGFVSPDETGFGATGQRDGSAYFLPTLDPQRLRDSGLGRLLLHQYLHAWVPGRFGPVALESPRWSAPPAFRDQWFVEGTAEYYAQLLPARYGEDGRQAFYDAMGTLLTRWREMGGSDRIDPETLLRTVRREGDQTDRTRLLVGGTLSALLIDLTIREETRGLRGLDQVVYYLERYTPPGGWDPDQVWRDVAGALGVPVVTLGPLTEGGGLSIEAGLARGGLRMDVRDRRARTLGARLQAGPGGSFVVGTVEPGGTAASAGLRDGDRLLKINQTPVSPDDVVATNFALETFVRRAPTGSRVTFEIERNGERRDLDGTVRESRIPDVTVREDPEATPTAMVVRSSLFHPTTASTGR